MPCRGVRNNYMDILSIARQGGRNCFKFHHSWVFGGASMTDRTQTLSSDSHVLMNHEQPWWTTRNHGQVSTIINLYQKGVNLGIIGYSPRIVGCTLEPLLDQLIFYANPSGIVHGNQPVKKRCYQLLAIIDNEPDSPSFKAKYISNHLLLLVPATYIYTSAYHGQM